MMETKMNKQWQQYVDALLISEKKNTRYIKKLFKNMIKYECSYLKFYFLRNEAKF